MHNVLFSLHTGSQISSLRIISSKDLIGYLLPEKRCVLCTIKAKNKDKNMKKKKRLVEFHNHFNALSMIKSFKFMTVSLKLNI